MNSAKELTHTEPTKQQVQQIVAQAIWSPSGDNCQPWKFVYRDNTLSIFHLEERGRHSFNVFGLTSKLAFGTLIEAIRLASAAVGYDIRIEWQPLTLGQVDCWAKVSFAHQPQPIPLLHSALLERTCDRRIYQGGELSAKILQHSLSAQDLHPVRLHWCSGVPEPLLNYMTEAELTFLQHPTALTEVLNWTRFSERSARQSGDGLSYKNLGIPAYELPLVWLLRTIPALVPMARSEFARRHRSIVIQQLRSSAGLVCVSAPVNSDLAVTKAGSLMMRAWLELNLQGYGVHPTTSSSMGVYLKAMKLALDETHPMKEMYTTGEIILRDVFQIPEHLTPIWMVRTGRISPLPRNQRTFRRSLTNVLSFS